MNVSSKHVPSAQVHHLVEVSSRVARHTSGSSPPVEYMYIRSNQVCAPDESPRYTLEERQGTDAHSSMYTQLQVTFWEYQTIQ